MATTIDELVISLGLDLSKFEQDYAAASKEVNEATKKLTRDVRLEKLRMDIDMSKFDAAQTSIGAFNTKIGHLNTMLENQKNAVLLTAKAHEEATKKLGENANGTKRLEERLLREQKAQAELEKQLRQTNKERKEASVLGKVGDTAGTAANAGGAAMAALSVVSTKAAVDAVENENLFKESFGGMSEQARAWSKGLRDELGLNDGALRKSAGTFNVMFKSMGLGAPKAYELSTGLTKLGQDMASFYNLSPDQAFTKLKSGMTGEMEPLKELGILVDEQTVKQTAWSNGIARQGAELTNQEKVLARYATILDQTASAQGDLARTADSPANQIRKLKAEAEMLEVEFGTKLLPTLQEMMGELQNVADAFNGMSKSSQDGAMELVKVGAEIAIANTALRGMAWALGATISPWVTLGIVIGTAVKGLEDYLTKQKEAKEVDTSKNLIGEEPSKTTAKVRQAPDGSWEKESNELGYITNKTYTSNRPISGYGKKWVKLTGDELDEVQKKAERTKFALMKGDNPDSSKAIEDAKKEASEKEALEKIKRAEAERTAEETKDLNNETYKLTHNNLEAELKDIDRKAEKYKDQKLNEVDVAKWAEAAKAHAREQFKEDVTNQIDSAFKTDMQNRLDSIDHEKTAWEKKGLDEVRAEEWAAQQKSKIQREWNDQVAAQMDAVFQTGLQARLNGIEREKQAWIQKGLDEVKATKLAEEQKAQAIRETALNAIQQHRDYIEMLRAAMNGGVATTSTIARSGAKIIDTYGDGQDALSAARQQILAKEREKIGIKPGDTFSPELMNETDQSLKWVHDNLIPGMTSDSQQGTRDIERASMDITNKSMYGSGSIRFNFDSNTSGEIENVKAQVSTLSDTFAAVGQDSATKFFQPFHEQLTNLVGNIDASANKSGDQQTINNIAPTVTVNINNPQVQSNMDITSLADQVADKITPAIKQAIGGDQNSY